MFHFKSLSVFISSNESQIVLGRNCISCCHHVDMAGSRVRPEYNGVVACFDVSIGTARVAIVTCSLRRRRRPTAWTVLLAVSGLSPLDRQQSTLRNIRQTEPTLRQNLFAQTWRHVGRFHYRSRISSPGFQPGCFQRTGTALPHPRHHERPRWESLETFRYFKWQ